MLLNHSLLVALTICTKGKAQQKTMGSNANPIQVSDESGTSEQQKLNAQL